MIRIAAVFFALCLSVSTWAQQTSEADYQAKLQELQATIAQLKTELAKVKSDRDALQNDLQTSEVDISDLVKKIERLKGDLSQQKKQLAQLNSQRTELRQQRKSQQQAIAEQVNAAYRLGRQSELKLVLNQQQPDQVARMLKYYDYFIDARAERIETYLDTIAELNRVEPAIEAKAAELNRNRKTLEQRFDQLSQRQAERERTLKRLNSAIASKDQQLKQKAEDRQRLEQLLSEVTQALANLALPGDSQPFAQKRGKLAWPTQGKMLQRYGSNRAGKLRWEGVLIGAPSGREVKAVHHGRVVFADYLRGHGLLIIVDHGNGYMSLYAHNQSLLKETGDWVSANEVVAQVGNSGGQSQAALYFEIRHQGKPLNPAQWCRS
jgi:septal ring factor EnvC (AmiA/AmiB activator)